MTNSSSSSEASVSVADGDRVREGPTLRLVPGAVAALGEASQRDAFVEQSDAKAGQASTDIIEGSCREVFAEQVDCCHEACCREDCCREDSREHWALRRGDRSIGANLLAAASRKGWRLWCSGHSLRAWSMSELMRSPIEVFSKPQPSCEP